MESVFQYGNEQSGNVLLQMVGDHDMDSLEREVQLIRELSGTSDFRLIAVKVNNWNDDLSPWPNPAVFGNEGFGGYAEKTLKKLMDEVVEPVRTGASEDLKMYIGGYSLSALFALWAVYQTDIFSGCAAASPSMWFPGFVDYISDKTILTDRVYLSLGNKEEKTRNPVMRQVGDSIRRTHEMLKDKINVILEWNEGNHFKDADLRTAKGFASVLKKE